MSRPITATDSDLVGRVRSALTRDGVAVVEAVLDPYEVRCVRLPVGDSDGGAGLPSDRPQHRDHDSGWSVCLLRPLVPGAAVRVASWDPPRPEGDLSPWLLEILGFGQSGGIAEFIPTEDEAVVAGG